MKRFSVLALLCLSLPAYAQEHNTYSGGGAYSSETAAYSRALNRAAKEKEGYITPRKISVALVHPAYMEDDQVGIELSVPDAVSGCFEFSPLEYEVSFGDSGYMDVRVGDYRRTVTPSTTGFCAGSTRTASSVILLDRDDIRQRSLYQIRFSLGGVPDRYTVKLDGDTLTLTPDGAKKFKSRAPILTHVFGDSGLIALHVPMAGPDEDVSAAVRSFAARNALTPASGEAISNPMDGKQVFYYRDSQGTLASRIGSEGYTDVGSVAVGRPYRGPQGVYTRQVPLRIYATRPGQTL